MVRAITGTLLEVGKEKLSVDGFEEIILKKDRCAAGMSMPAKGLFLTGITYPEIIYL
jgi:tRNA pseudouridine38-40 synthase